VKKKTKARGGGRVLKKKRKVRPCRVIKMKTKAQWVKFLCNSYPGYHPRSIDEDELDRDADRWFKFQQDTICFFREKGGEMVEVLRQAITRAAFTNRVVALDIDFAQNILNWLVLMAAVTKPPGNAKHARHPLFDFFDIQWEWQEGRLPRTAIVPKAIAGHMMKIWKIKKEGTACKAVAAALKMAPRCGIELASK
jgi:hypothetical protein